MTRLLGISLTMTSNHLYKHGTLKMGVALRKAIYAKMMQQDMSHFEQKFKRKDQARVMLNVYLSQKVRKRVFPLRHFILKMIILPRQARDKH